MPPQYLVPVQEAISWLTQFEGVDSFLDPSIKIHFVELVDALASGDPVRAKEILTHLLRLAKLLGNNMEAAEICLRCGLYYYRLDEFEPASRLLREAAGRFAGWSHQSAVAYWMLGYVLWETVATKDDAILAWRRGLGLFEKSLNKDRYHTTRSDWYLNHIKLRREELERMLTPAQPAPLLLPKTWDLVAEAPRGGFGPLGTLAPRTGLVNRSPLTLGGQPYRLELLSQYTEPEIEGFEGLVVYRYPREGMDRAGIRRDDYVLLRWQDDAEDGEIVAAEIIDRGGQVELRRLSRGGGLLVLSPESTGAFQPRAFPAASRRMRLRAIVLAVLK